MQFLLYCRFDASIINKVRSLFIVIRLIKLFMSYTCNKEFITWVFFVDLFHYVLIYSIDYFGPFRGQAKSFLKDCSLTNDIKYTWIDGIYKNDCRIYRALLGRDFLASSRSYFVLLDYCIRPEFRPRRKPFSLPYFPLFSWYILRSYTGQMLHRDAYKCGFADEAILFYEFMSMSLTLGYFFVLVLDKRRLCRLYCVSMILFTWIHLNMY